MQVAVIGMGPAAVSAVKSLREENERIGISMFSAENCPPYSPPCLGDFLLTGETDSLFWQGRDFAERFRVNSYAGDPVFQLVPEEQKLITRSGLTVYWDKLIIASGSSLYSPVPGSEKSGVSQFKNFAGASALRDLASQRPGARIVVAGGGFIGVEIALYLAKLGLKPVLLNRRGWIMPRLLDPETSGYVQEDLEEQGVEVRLNTEAREFVGDNGVQYLLASGGERFQGEGYVAATGVKPNLDFLEGTDIRVEQGIWVDNFLKSSRDNIFVCGDAAQARELVSGENSLQGLYPLAVKQGEIVGKNVLGHCLEYQPQPNMNSLKGLSFKLIVAGSQKGDEVVYRGSDYLKKFFIEQDKLQGFVMLGDVTGAGNYTNLLQLQRNLSELKSPGLKPQSQCRALHSVFIR